MPEQKPEAKTSVSTNPPRKSYPPLGEGRANGYSIPSEERMRAAIKACSIEELAEMGSRAKPALFKMIQNPEEDLVCRRMAADAATLLYGSGMRLYDRLLCLILQDNVEGAAPFGDEAVLPVMGVLKNRKENTLLRSIAVEVLISMPHGTTSYSKLAVVAALSSMLANEEEAPILRAKIADEFPKLARVCDGAKMKMMMSALERAAASQSSGVAFAAEEAIQLIENGSSGFVDDDDSTLRLPGTK